MAAAGLIRMPTSPFSLIKAHSAAMRFTTSSALIGRWGGASSVMETGVAVSAALVKTPTFGGLDQALARRRLKPSAVIRLAISGRELKQDGGRVRVIHSHVIPDVEA